MQEDFKIINESENAELERGRNLFKKSLIFFVVVFLIVGSFFAGRSYEQKQNLATDEEKVVPLNQAIIEGKVAGADSKVDFSLFWKVWDLVKDKHIERDKINAQEMVYGAINGMLQATGDPYSSFFDPKSSKEFSQEIEGSFDGIGAELGIKDNLLTVIAPLDGSPSEKAGLRAGDKILRINGEVAADISIDEAVDKIRGKKGTEVVLTILHEGAEETQDVTVVRDTIEVKTVKLEFRNDNIAYLKVTRFGESTGKEFDLAVNEMISKSTKGIVLDLRNNPGGLLDESVDVASRMIPKGKIVVTEEDSTGKKDNLTTLGGDKLSNIPTVVLINEGSASASEILAGALKDNQGITLIGMKSFGKGSVQQLIPLPGGSSVKITIAKWLTPKGDYIMEKGIAPDVEVDLALDDFKNNRDPQLEKAMEVIEEKVK